MSLPTPAHSGTPDGTIRGLQARLNIALSIARNDTRPPERALHLVRLALEGATVHDLYELERLGL